VSELVLCKKGYKSGGSCVVQSVRELEMSWVTGKENRAKGYMRDTNLVGGFGLDVLGYETDTSDTASRT
jgi:hypothetical protein